MERFLGRFAPHFYALLRFMAGVMFMMHGTQKLFAWPGDKAAATATLSIVGGWIELICGAMIAIGFEAGFAAFLASGTMAVAYFLRHAGDGFWPIVNRGELAVVYCFLFLFVAATGSGIWSVDALRDRRGGRICRIMKTILTLALALLLCSPVFAADPKDSAALVQDLERTRAKFLESVEGLSDAQWNYKPAPDKWSIGECAEHVAASEPFIRGYIAKSMENAAPADALKEARKDEKILTFITDRSQKFKSPEPIAPAKRFSDRAATLASFEKERAETIKLAQRSADMRAFAAPHPAFGMVDAHGWVLFLSGHSERHTLQIEEVKASEGFPKE